MLVIIPGIGVRCWSSLVFVVMLVTFLHIADSSSFTFSPERTAGRAYFPAAHNKQTISVEGRTTAWPGGVSFDFQGVKVSTRFTNTSLLALNMIKEGNITDFFVVLMDGIFNAIFSTQDWISGQSTTLILANNIDPSMEHDVVVFKSTEPMWSELVPNANFVTFESFSGDVGMQLLLPLTNSSPISFKLEFLGDSITAGYCNLCDVFNSTNDPGYESFYLSWPTQICNALNATCHTAAWSGYGMVMNCCGGETLMSDVWKRTLATVPSKNGSDPHGTIPENEWDFSLYIPDAVIINLGTNDNLGSRPNLISLYNQTYLNLIKDAAKIYGPNVHFFLACGPMSDSYCDEVNWVIQQSIDLQIKASFLDFRGFLNGTFGESCCGHPGSQIDQAMAKYATTVIKTMLLEKVSR